MRRFIGMLVATALLGPGVPCAGAQELPPSQVAAVGFITFVFVPGTNFSPVPTLFVAQGGRLEFTNLSPLFDHTVTDDACLDPELPCRFDTGEVVFGGTLDVPGVAALPAGEYPFHCALHTAMQGTLVVT